MDNMAIWSRFTESGSVEDYLMYKRASEKKKKPNFYGEPDYEDEYGWSDTQGTKYW